MVRFGFFLLVCVAISTSCEKCKQCTYSYDVTTIVQTINGEEEQVTTISGAVLADSSGESFSEECINENKGESFTIEQWYQNKKDTTSLDNFQINCVDL